MICGGRAIAGYKNLSDYSSKIYKKVVNDQMCTQTCPCDITYQKSWQNTDLLLKHNRVNSFNDLTPEQQIALVGENGDSASPWIGITNSNYDGPIPMWWETLRN